MFTSFQLFNRIFNIKYKLLSQNENSFSAQKKIINVIMCTGAMIFGNLSKYVSKINGNHKFEDILFSITRILGVQILIRKKMLNLQYMSILVSNIYIFSRW